MVTKEIVRSTLAQMEPGQKVEISNDGRSVNAIRNAASLVGREKGLVFSCHVNWDAAVTTVSCVSAR